MDEPTETGNTKQLLSKNFTMAHAERLKHETRVAELVSRLMAHFWTSDDHPAARQLQLEDWIECLDGYPADVVRRACQEWLQHNTRRPMPAEILGKCREINKMRIEAKTLYLPAPETADGRLAACVRQFATCHDRWDLRGFICKAECRQHIQGYYPKRDI